jgi:hypothetical protein
MDDRDPAKIRKKENGEAWVTSSQGHEESVLRGLYGNRQRGLGKQRGLSMLVVKYIWAMTSGSGRLSEASGDSSLSQKINSMKC